MLYLQFFSWHLNMLFLACCVLCDSHPLPFKQICSHMNHFLSVFYSVRVTDHFRVSSRENAVCTKISETSSQYQREHMDTLPKPSCIFDDSTLCPLSEMKCLIRRGEFSFPLYLYITHSPSQWKKSIEAGDWRIFPLRLPSACHSLSVITSEGSVVLVCEKLTSLALRGGGQ